MNISMKTFKSWLNENNQVTFAGKDPMTFESPKGGKPIWLFSTAQGSQYLVTNDGMVLRNKSFHANTGGEDAGLQRWSDQVEFYDTSSPLVQGGMQNLNFPDTLQYLSSKGQIALSKSQRGERVAMILDNGQWRAATLTDAMPKAVQQNPQWGNIIIKSSRWGMDPQKNWQPLDYTLGQNGILKSVHNGSPVTNIIKLQ